MAQLGNLIVNGVARILGDLKVKGEVAASSFIGNLTGQADKAAKDSKDQDISKTYIKGLSANGRTVTYTKGDGTTGTITTQDTNTTYSTGTTSAAGLTKLYTSTGTATDGTMTQNAIKTALDGKLSTSGGTLTGNTTTTGSGAVDVGYVAQNTDTKASVSLMVGSGKYNRGVYDKTANKWIAYADQNNAVHLTGNADTATTATKLSSSAGSATQPVYFTDGKPAACSYTLAKSVPADAKFTDTNTWRGVQNNLTSESTSDSLSAYQGKVLKGMIDDKSSLDHTHKYAGSNSVGGSANSAVKLDTTTAGSATQPVYFADGKPAACTYTLGASVPSDAKFTDTNTWRPVIDNLASDDTESSLSAAQGKKLAMLLDGNAHIYKHNSATIISNEWTYLGYLNCDSYFTLLQVQYWDITEVDAPIHVSLFLISKVTGNFEIECLKGGDIHMQIVSTKYPSYQNIRYNISGSNDSKYKMQLRAISSQALSLGAYVTPAESPTILSEHIPRASNFISKEFDFDLTTTTSNRAILLFEVNLDINNLLPITVELFCNENNDRSVLHEVIFYGESSSCNGRRRFLSSSSSYYFTPEYRYSNGHLSVFTVCGSRGVEMRVAGHCKVSGYGKNFIVRSELSSDSGLYAVSLQSS